MMPKTFLNTLGALLGNFPLASFLWCICLLTLSSCNVDPSFGYAFAGTGAIMIVGLVIATFVTSRNKKREGEKD
jgi:hypothetical protein